MKLLRGLSRSAVLAVALVGLKTGVARGQLASTDVDSLQQQGQVEGWTFDVAQNPATHRTIEALCELQPPADWQSSGRTNPFPQIPNGQLAVPTSFDWRTQNGCTAIRNQGGCGSCWAFATVGVMESALLIKDGITQNLSEQYLVSCNRSGWSCNGGWFAHAYHHNTAGSDAGGIGAVLDSAKPYTATNSACGGALSHLYAVNNWYYVDPSTTVPSTTAIKQAILTYGPVSVAVYVGSAFQAYTSGVFNACPSGTVNHAVVLVGWNDTDQAWIMRNSWGTGWGEQGYMRIRYGCSQIGYGACYVDYGSSSSQGASMSSPTPSSTLSSQSVQFQWNADSNATEYWLTIGDAAGKANIYSKTQGTNTSVTVDNLPASGVTLYVKLFSKIGGKFYGRAYTYTAATLTPASAVMTSPTLGGTLDSSTANFAWSAGTRVGEYYLWVGTTRGGYNLYNKSQGLNRSVSVSNLPAGGRSLYVRLFSKIGTTWQQNDYTYTSPVGAAEAAAMTDPAGGSTFDSSTATFNWSEGLGVDEYMVQIGTSAAGKNIYSKSLGRGRSLTLSGLATNGSTLYVRLWSKCSGVWKYNDYQYTTANLTRGPADMTSPAGGSTLTSTNVTFSWSEGVGVTGYWLAVGTALGKTDLYNKTTGLVMSASVTGLPIDGRTLYVRLWSQIAGVWQKRDYTYTATSATATPADITSPASGSTLTSSIATFTWSAGVGASEYWLTIGKTAGGSTYYTASLGLNTSVTVTNLPTDGSTLYVRLSSKIGGSWRQKDYTYRAASPGSARPADNLAR